MDLTETTNLEIGKFNISFERDYWELTLLIKEGARKIEYFIYPDAATLDKHYDIEYWLLEKKYRKKIEASAKKLPKPKRNRSIPSKVWFKM